MEKEQALSRDELRKVRPPMRSLYISQKEKLKLTHKVASWITEKVGTMGFFYILIIWTVIWLGWNMYAPIELRFDPFPAFVLWLFISNLIQLILMPIIMVGQNLQGRHADARAQADFELNQIAELEIDTILIHLENQNDSMLDVLDKTDKILFNLEEQNKLIIKALNKIGAKVKK